MTIILILLFICHYLGDYVLTSTWMLDAKRLGKPWFPIFIHASIHAYLMYFALEIYSHFAYGTMFFEFTWDLTISDKLFVLQLGSHYIIDTWKGRMNVWFPPLNIVSRKAHWIVFGFDQLLHAIVIIAMAHYMTHQ